MDYLSALAEFSTLLQVGASALQNIALDRSTELEPYLSELRDITTRLREIGDALARIAAAGES